MTWKERLQDGLQRLKQRRRPRSYRDKFRTRGRFGTGLSEPQRTRPQRWLRRFMLGCLAVALVAGGLLGASLAWQVKTAEVKGASVYTPEELLEAAGIQPGARMLSFDGSTLREDLLARYPLLTAASVSRRWNGAVTLSVTEESELLWTRHYQNAYLISADTLRVLEVASSPEGWWSRGVKAVYIELPEQAWLAVGDRLTYRYLTYPAEGEAANETVADGGLRPATEQYAYVESVRQTVMASALGERVTGLSLEDRYDLWFLVDGRIQVRLGNTEDLAYKLSQAVAVLDRQSESSGRGVLDASVPAAVSYRAVSDLALPEWAGE